MITQCDTCGKTINRQKSWLRGKHHFCNKQCHIKFQSTIRGEETNNWRGGPYQFNCKFCSRLCIRKRNKIKPKYCSIECASKDGAMGHKGENHHNWKGRMDTRYLRKIAPRPKPERCEICNKLGSDFHYGLHYDHDHKTGKFRGWICTNCNTALGLVNDDPKILQALIKYIEINENPF